MTRKHMKYLYKVMLAIFAVMVYASLFPLAAIADDPPKGSLSLDEVNVETPEVSQGDPINVTLKASYVAPTDYPQPIWMCIAEILIYDSQGKLVYGDEYNKELWENWKPGVTAVACGEEGESGTFNQQISIPTDELDPGTHTFSLEMYGSQRVVGLGKPFWVQYHFTEKASFSATVQATGTVPQPPVTDEPSTAPAGDTQPGFIQVTVDTSPPQFQDLGDEIEITVIVTDEDGMPIPGELVQVVSTEPQGEWAQSYTDMSGAAIFRVIHYDTQVLNYKYFVSAAGQDNWLDIPVAAKPPGANPTVPPTTAVEGDLVISVENNYTTIAADGKNQLQLTADLSGGTGGTGINWYAMKSDDLQDITTALTVIQESDNSSTVSFLPPPGIFPNYEVEIRAEVSGTSINNRVKIIVMPPPVILVHGVWSNPESLKEVMGPRLYHDYFSRKIPQSDWVIGYANFSGGVTKDTHTSNQSILISKAALESAIQSMLSAAENNSTKVGQFDIVAHSMGGLVTRLYMQENPGRVRKLVTLATPHLGSPVADWYQNLMDNQVQTCTSIADYKSDKVTLAELEHFIGYLQKEGKFEPYLLFHGKAVTEMQQDGNAGSVQDRLNPVPDSSAEYYFIAGDKPIIGEFLYLLGGGVALKDYPFQNKEGGCGQKFENGFSPGYESMVKGFFNQLHTTGTDGVVPLNSAWAGLGQSHANTTLAHLNHIDITQNPGAVNAVIRYLSDESRRLTGYLITSFSPGNLHVYDTFNHHVGLDASGNPAIEINGADYASFSSATGFHEAIWLPPGTEGIRVEFVGSEEGIVGLDIGQGLEDGLHSTGYQEIEVQYGSVVSLQVDRAGGQATLTDQNGETTMLAPTYSDFIPSSVGLPSQPAQPQQPPMSPTDLPMDSDTWTIFYASACAWTLVAGGLLVIFLVSRRRTIARWVLPVSLWVAVLCTILTCVLGFVAFGSPSAGGTMPVSQPQAPPPAAGGPINQPPVATAPVVQPPARGTGQVSLTITNDLSGEVCFILLSPSGREQWGEDWLGDGYTLPPGYLVELSVPAGTYDLQALDCAGNVLVEMYSREVRDATEWTLVEE